MLGEWSQNLVKIPQIKVVLRDDSTRVAFNVLSNLNFTSSECFSVFAAVLSRLRLSFADSSSATGAHNAAVGLRGR